MKLYGIKNCDKVRQARRLLEASGRTYQYIDLRNPPISRDILEKWLTDLNNEIINKRSTTYREKKEEIEAVKTLEELIELCQTYPTLIKRPILEVDNDILIGDEVLNI